ncbi:DUF6931 family protein [Roseivivax sediminis]|uniref:Uncharacterized protein n=1 Tax=Roseivivax sediminis TaxID=936889 RepID=A0A1I1Z926_9RHOB|nr:hypothetical protein [Roseivivax sediminis]SFE28354.1 hypothetical protein SAMN04515678_10856 [Roseivivax sediminis]
MTDGGGNLPASVLPEPPDRTDAAELPEADRTRPPRRTLRHDGPAELFESLPEIARLTQHRPRPGDTTRSYLTRLRQSATPEEAITFAAFAAEPRTAIWWGHACLSPGAGQAVPDADRAMMGLVRDWLLHPDESHRWATMQAALFATRRSPAVLLGLAVGWSGGPPAPNDPAPAPRWRQPQALNAAVLSQLAETPSDVRRGRLQDYVDAAAALFGVR